MERHWERWDETGVDYWKGDENDSLDVQPRSGVALAQSSQNCVAFPPFVQLPASELLRVYGCVLPHLTGPDSGGRTNEEALNEILHCV